MRFSTRWLVPTIAVALTLAVVGTVGLLDAVPLVRASHSITEPKSTVALSVHLSSYGGKNTAPRATVVYDTPHGRYTSQLPRLGHSANDYPPPVHLIYDARRPARVILASDWRRAHSGWPSQEIWWSATAAGLGVVSLLSTIGLSVLRRRHRLSNEVAAAGEQI